MRQRERGREKERGKVRERGKDGEMQGGNEKNIVNKHHLL